MKFEQIFVSGLTSSDALTAMNMRGVTEQGQPLQDWRLEKIQDLINGLGGLNSLEKGREPLEEYDPYILQVDNHLILVITPKTIQDKKRQIPIEKVFGFANPTRESTVTIAITYPDNEKIPPTVTTLTYDAYNHVQHVSQDGRAGFGGGIASLQNNPEGLVSPLLGIRLLNPYNPAESDPPSQFTMVFSHCSFRQHGLGGVSVIDFSLT